MWPKIQFVQTFMGVLVTCKKEEDPFKNEGARVCFCLFDLIFYVPSTIFQLNRDGSSSV